MAAKAVDEPSNAHLLKEWETAREVLSKFDDRLHDLRKIGFTFITALLSADAIIFVNWIEGVELPDYIKLAVLLVTLLLIVTLLLVDRNYQIFQRAAATRAKILERRLNLELTEVIAQRYRTQSVQDYVTSVYMLFTGGVFFLGVAALSDPITILVLLIAWIGTIYAIYRANNRIGMRYPYGTLDWTIDRLQCKSGETIQITLTNLSADKEIPKDPFPSGTVMWQIVPEDDENAVKTEELDHPLSIGADDSHTWLWETKSVQKGIYRVRRIILDKKTGQPAKKLVPLKRKIRVE